MIDFGLSFVSNKIEDKAVDIYVLKRALISSHPGSENLFEKLLQKYQ
jgi:TP53 regulating kinase-like protein